MEADDAAAVPVEALLDVRVRVSAELGRAQVPVSRAVTLDEGAIVELDREPDEAIDFYVNGLFYGTGRLLELDGEWAVRIETVGPGDGRPATAATPSSGA